MRLLTSRRRFRSSGLMSYKQKNTPTVNCYARWLTDGHSRAPPRAISSIQLVKLVDRWGPPPLQMLRAQYLRAYNAIVLARWRYLAEIKIVWLPHRLPSVVVHGAALPAFPASDQLPFLLTAKGDMPCRLQPAYCAGSSSATRHRRDDTKHLYTACILYWSAPCISILAWFTMLARLAILAAASVRHGEDADGGPPPIDSCSPGDGCQLPPTCLYPPDCDSWFADRWTDSTRWLKSVNRVPTAGNTVGAEFSADHLQQRRVRTQ